MAEPKTRPTKVSVTAFLRKAAEGETHRDCLTLVKIMKQATKAEPVMWGPSIVGFGRFSLRYASGRELDWPLVAFSPRKRDLTLYIASGFARRETLLRKLGRHRTSKACLYIKRLADVDLAVLKELIAASVAHTKRRHGSDGR